MKHCYHLFFILLVLGLTKTSGAQDSTSRFRTAGGMVGYGKAVNKQTDYQIFFLAGDFSWSFKKHPRKKDFVAWYLEPQINPVRTPRPLDIEFGTNIGIRNYIKVNEDFYLYQMLGTGPHFISAEVKRQANGFIFSDNFAMGAFTRVKNSLFLNLQLRWRHISNAGLQRPNSGIDSYNFFLGLSRFK